MQIKSIPMRWGSGDNYAYLVIDTPTKHAWLIDAAEPEDVYKYLKENKPGFELKAIVNTHHHYDHSDGNKEFHKKYPDLPVVAGKDSPLVSYTPSHQEVIDLGDNLSITALHTPCHTQDSICYYVEDSKTNERAVFTGDTLFVSGCGRFFEGNGEEMDRALNKVLGKLPKDTKVYPGHEYTKLNVKFSSTILKNAAIDRLVNFVKTNEFTTGEFTIGDELEHNPFMRLTDPQVLKVTGEHDRTAVMTKLRELKNNS
ncbi:hydroxyacylglutathione hydrolase [Suhomyces tanzawaensis NRRL Y-17324]|uniref:hydroxyacylglutathione hydrolase n=1 Tax=Suhomyces tanzawaensis NRRL Y-17324 TaxID=984487 RepID=A0A1E4SSA7_9ASCO|nr:hydroxyacylglutathione hydrolase [Suhomyces tanzawaensis NRRL Y-17324]ODV82398.1 hydroxyacylglutathione hydrolase [Suhomyces tanzawaensis NRRL Y-17324]